MKKRIASLAALIVLTVLLSGCWQGIVGGGSSPSIPSITQAMGDQDLTLDNNKITVAGQAEAVRVIDVYIITIDQCVQMPDPFYVKVPANKNDTTFVFTVRCDGVTTWIVTATA